MLRYWVKNRFIFDILISFILSILVCFAFVSPMINNTAEAYEKQSLYINTDIDFDVPSPAVTQIAELEAQPSINKVVPYRYTKTSVKANNKNRTTNIFLFDDFADLAFTMYSQDRCIAQSDLEFDNPIYIDYLFAAETNTSIGDEVFISFSGHEIKFVIAAIFETNTYYDGGAVAIKWVGEQKDVILANSPNLAYSGAYIIAADVPQCKTYLKDNYKPYGRLNDRSEFATEEAYQTHYQAFMSANYANEITDFGENAKSAEVVANEKFSSATKLLVLGAVIFFVVAIALDLALYFRKSERGYFKKRQKAGKIKCSSSHSVYYLNSMIVQIIISIATVSVVVFVLLKSLTIYVPASYIIWKYFVIVAVMILTAIIANGLSVILVKNRQKFQQQKSDKLQSNSEVKKQEPSNVKEDSEDGKQEPDKNGSAEQKPSNGNADTEEGKQEPDKNGAAEQEQLKAKKIQKK